jgi:mono/diheme cytochrome c family protein
MSEGDLEPGVRRWVVIGLGVLVVAGVIAAVTLRPKPAPPPEEIGNDPLLAAGHALYHQRCVSCHGATGKGDGPIAATLPGTPPGDLTDDKWTRGDRPDQVLEVIRNGVPGSQMAGWKGSYSEDELRSVAAYVFHLAGRDVPAALRGPIGE